MNFFNVDWNALSNFINKLTSLPIWGILAFISFFLIITEKYISEPFGLIKLYGSYKWLIFLTCVISVTILLRNFFINFIRNKKILDELKWLNNDEKKILRWAVNQTKTMPAHLTNHAFVSLKQKGIIESSHLIINKFETPFTINAYTWNKIKDDKNFQNFK